MEAFLELFKDVWDFLKTRKKYWLAPLIITIFLTVLILILSTNLYGKEKNMIIELKNGKVEIELF